jgi:hypothetical protein
MTSKFQSRFVSGMWAIGSVSGPVVGGAFAEKGKSFLIIMLKRIVIT